MIIHYINLDSSAERRRSLENSFAQTRPPGDWQLSRFSAIGEEDPRVIATAGSRNGGEKGCFLSHATLLQSIAQSTETHWVVEDDIQFFPQAYAAVTEFLKNHQDDDWDLLFTDTTIRSYGAMVDLYFARKKAAPGVINYVNLRGCPFGSTVSYVVNPKRTQKVAAVLAPPPSIDKPLDIYMCDAVQEGKLTAYFTLPFVTSFAQCALVSEIRDHTLGLAGIQGRTLRGLMCVSPDVECVKELLNKIDNKYLDDESVCFGKIMASFMSDNFPKA